MLDAARVAIDFVSARDAGDCDFHPIELLGLEKLVENIGEAAGRLSPATRERMPEIAWKQMIGMRHVLVHDYFDVDLLRPHLYSLACHNRRMDADLQRGLEALAAEHELLAIYVFGSRAQEIASRAAGHPVTAAHPESDVDVGVEPRRGRTLSAQDRVRLMHRLETLLDAERVDLVILPEANAFLAADVVRGELLLTTDLDAEAEVQLYYLRRAADLAPLLRGQWRETVGSDL